MAGPEGSACEENKMKEWSENMNFLLVMLVWLPIIYWVLDHEYKNK